MKTTTFSLASFVTVLLASTAFALTTEREITSAYVREHPQEFSVSVIKGKDGLIGFTITHDVARPMYHVAHLAVYHQGKLIATSDTPVFGKQHGNEFSFSIAAEDIPESRFDLTDSGLDSSGSVPVPGSIIHQFRLLDFVPKELLKASPNK